MHFTYFKYIVLIIGLFAINISNTENVCAQSVLDKKISFEVKNLSLDKVLFKIQKKCGINFSYSNQILELNKNISVRFVNTRLKDVLDSVFSNTTITYKDISGTITVYSNTLYSKPLIIKGKILNSSNSAPIVYAGIMLLGSGKGCISDYNGNFSMRISKKDLNDTLLISCLGFKKRYFLAFSFTISDEHIVYLNENPVALNEVTVKPGKYKTKTYGNNKILSFGSIYIDTRGQQTALYIDDCCEKNAKITHIKYYLSRRGNTLAPFRIRLYEKDTTTNTPGKDLLPEIVIAKPDVEHGWYSANISQYNIDMPQNGVFAAIEGIYPVNFSSSANNEFYAPNTISYGQQLGYSRKKGNNTWHYSLAQTWFQLESDNYNVMIAIDVQIYKREKNEIFKNLFKRK